MIARYLLSYAGDTERAQAEAAFFVANLGSPAMRAHTDAWYSRRGQVLTQHLDERALGVLRIARIRLALDRRRFGRVHGRNHGRVFAGRRGWLSAVAHG